MIPIGNIIEHYVLLAYVGVGTLYFAAFFLPPRLLRRWRRINGAVAEREES